MRWLLLAVLVGGCTPAVDHWATRAPDGQMAAMVTCNDFTDCHEEMVSQCPAGYWILTSGTGEARAVTSRYGYSLLTKTSVRQEFMFRCR